MYSCVATVFNLGKLGDRIRHIDDVMVSMVASNVVDRWFEPRSGQIKDYKIGICYFSAKHAALRRKSKDWLAQNQDNVDSKYFLFILKGYPVVENMKSELSLEE
jgi:hypothetical protein